MIGFPRAGILCLSSQNPLTDGCEKTNPVFKHNPALDGVRGLAILLVMLFHLDWMVPSLNPYVKGGFLGVDVFFVLSGFLITSILLAEHGSNGQISLRRFYMRRCLRLLPAFLFFLTCFLILGPLLIPGLWSTLKEGPFDVLFALTYTMNWVSATNNVTVLNLNHTWSLSIEEQFYILWSLVLYKAFAEKYRKVNIRRAAMIAIGLLIAARAGRSLAGVDPDVLYYSTDTRIDALLAGCLASMLLVWGPAKRTARFLKLLRYGCALSVIAILFCVAYFSHADVGLFVWGMPLFTTSVAAILYYLSVSDKGLFHDLLSHRLLCWIGQVSYGLYLWHYFVYDIIKNSVSDGRLQVPLAFSLAFAAAALSYYLIEIPFLRLKDRFEFAGELRPSSSRAH